jgi:DNA-binding XRE family transcriptional regulator
MPRKFMLQAQVVAVLKQSMRMNFMGARSSIGLFIRAMRTSQGLSQAELAIEIRCAPATVSNMERGKRLERGALEAALKYLCPMGSSTGLPEAAIRQIGDLHHAASLLDQRFK